MTDVVGIARLILAVVFVVAGWTKLSDRTGTHQALRQFGVPEQLARPVTLLLPLAELTVAGLLLMRGTAVVGAIGAALLLGLFIIAISVNLGRGNRVDCNCFGQLHSAPIGGLTLVRNVVLLALAVLVIADGTGGTNFWDWIADLSVAGWLVIAAALVAAAGFSVLAWPVLKRIDPVRKRAGALKRALGLHRRAAGPAGLPPGSDAPAFELESVGGDAVSLDALLAEGRPVLLLFTSAHCNSCSALMPELAGWQDEYADDLTFAVVGAGDEERNRTKAAEHGIHRFLLQERQEVATAYKFVGTPSAVVVSPAGKIACPLVAGADAIRDLVPQAASGATPNGEPLPPRGRRREALG